MTPLDMPTRRVAATTRLAYRTTTATARRDAAILAASSTIPWDGYPACCETGDKSLARFTGCPICVL